MTLRLVTLALAAVIMGVGCSGADGRSGETTPLSGAPVSSQSTASPESVASPTTAATTAPSSLPSSPVTTTVVTTTGATTTAAPPDTTTSVSVFIPPEVTAMQTAFEQFWATRLGCLRTPPTCDRDRLREVMASPQLDTVLALLEKRLVAGEISVPGAQANYFVFNSINPSFDGQSGVVEACIVNGDVSLKVNDPSDPADDEVVDDRLISNNGRFDMEIVDGQWKVTAAANLEVWEGVNNCPPPDS